MTRPRVRVGNQAPSHISERKIAISTLRAHEGLPFRSRLLPDPSAERLRTLYLSVEKKLSNAPPSNAIKGKLVETPPAPQIPSTAAFSKLSRPTARAYRWKEGEGTAGRRKELVELHCRPPNAHEHEYEAPILDGRTGMRMSAAHSPPILAPSRSFHQGNHRHRSLPPHRPHPGNAHYRPSCPHMAHKDAEEHEPIQRPDGRDAHAHYPFHPTNPTTAAAAPQKTMGMRIPNSKRGCDTRKSTRAHATPSTCTPMAKPVFARRPPSLPSFLPTLRAASDEIPESKRRRRRRRR
ncbi:hypothetical protein B0H16DRAFT_1723970 [Mycena metata]|uniref:Uncharacterized protein n=1 Tax=Mycena metata TaxID=1033252 RepID=A0AAD7IZ14_9AGAR|nr:hypothetical protein B0H16DRAFT_1723970 [Mycena metata]